MMPSVPLLSYENRVKVNIRYQGGESIQDISKDLSVSTGTAYRVLDAKSKVLAAHRNPKKDRVDIPLGFKSARLVTISETFMPYPGSRNARVWVRCDCGTERDMLATNVLSGNSQSCGCRQRELTIARNRSNYFGDDVPRITSSYRRACFIAQGGICAWCKESLIGFGERQDVDHCHTRHDMCSGYKTCKWCVRGLVHYTCNLMIRNWDWAVSENLQNIPDWIVNYLNRSAFESGV